MNEAIPDSDDPSADEASSEAPSSAKEGEEEALAPWDGQPWRCTSPEILNALFPSINAAAEAIDKIVASRFRLTTVRSHSDEAGPVIIEFACSLRRRKRGSQPASWAHAWRHP
jgi:hypothetical protein